MKITQITAHAARTFNHPHETYSNFKPGISLTAEIGEGEDVDKAMVDLQAKAEKAAEDLKQNILRNIEELREMSELTREVADLEKSLKAGAERLAKIRAAHPSVKFEQLQIGTMETETNF